MRSRFIVWAGLALLPAVGSAVMAPGLVGSLSAAAPPGTTLPSPAVLAGAAFIQALIMFGLAAAAGLWLAPHVGRRPEILYAWAERRQAPHGTAGSLLAAALVGLAAGLALVATDVFIFQAGAEIFPGALLARLSGAVLYGGVGEEVLCRLFLVSGLVYLISRITRGQGSVVWLLSIVVAALAFGAGHLPVASAMGIADSAGVLRILSLNGFAGIAFGLLYWRRGFEAAVVAHAAAHLPLQLAPLILRQLDLD